ncbi:MAG TPA: tyrosine-type recombinase/integrase, partial [bacterium]|nr:tyrosine-type recombinase/integrase [bacterium]
RWLSALAAEIPDTHRLDVLSVTRFFSRLRERRLAPNSLHQCYRTVKTFTRWCLALGVLRRNPLDGFVLKTPRTLPSVPSPEDVAALLKRCPATGFIGLRARAIVLFLADSGVRQSELRHLMIEHVDVSARTALVRGGKGAKDRPVVFGPITARALRQWLAVHPYPHPESPLFCAKNGNPIQKRNLVHTLHRLSISAKLARKVGPHALRHFAATSWLRHGVGLDQVRRLLGHSSLQTTLRYSSLVATDLKAAHKEASAVEKMRLVD